MRDQVHPLDLLQPSPEQPVLSPRNLALTANRHQESDRVDYPQYRYSLLHSLALHIRSHRQIEQISIPANKLIGAREQS